MAQELTGRPEYRATMRRLEEAKHTSADGDEFWMARDIHPILGYPVWDKFEPVIERAGEAFRGNQIEPSHHIAQTSKMMGVGQGGQRKGTDYFLSRPACYLIAMNGDPTKPEIAAAQAYFALQTRRMELDDERTADERRLELRDKVSKAVKVVSGTAQVAGVRSNMQGVFHDQRYQGLYGMSLRDLKGFKGLPEKDQLLDRVGLLELSMHDFQMNLAANVISKDAIKGEQAAIKANLAVARRVRKTIEDSKATLPEHLPLEPPIKEVKKRVESKKKLPPIGPSA